MLPHISQWTVSTTKNDLDPNINIARDTCTLMFIAALFTIAKTWKPPKCASTDEWVKKIWYI